MLAHPCVCVSVSGVTLGVVFLYLKVSISAVDCPNFLPVNCIWLQGDSPQARQLASSIMGKLTELELLMNRALTDKVHCFR